MSNCLSGVRVGLLPRGLLSLVSAMCPVLPLGNQVPEDTGAELPAQYTGQALLLTALGFSVRTGLTIVGSRYLLEQLAEGGKKRI